MERRIDYSVMQQQQVARQEQQAARAANSGIEGISKFYPKNEPLRVRVLVPFSFGIDFQVHTVKAQDSTDYYICEKQFSPDPMAYCPICDDVQKFREGGNDKFAGEISRKNKKVFLVYVYDWAGKTYQSQGVTKFSNGLGIWEIGPGDKVGKNFVTLSQAGLQYGVSENFGAFQRWWSYLPHPV